MASLTIPPFEIGAELLGGFGDVAVSINHRDVAHLSSP
jgi:hypothetical protein